VILLARHGETADNKDRRFQGQKDVPLNDTGREQARAIAEELARETIDAIYTSDLARARETAELIARAAGLTPEADERLAPGATAEDLRAATSDRGDTVVAVGHQPDCSTIVLALTGCERAFAPGAVQELQL
jgi:broad specificity phosphatase PhoE